MSTPQIFDLTGDTLKLFGTQVSTEDGITATASGTQATGYASSKTVSRVTTVGTAADSVLAPYAATPGAWFVMINGTATSMQVYGTGTDTINAAATATGVAVAANKTAIFWCLTAGAWRAVLALA